MRISHLVPLLTLLATLFSDCACDPYDQFILISVAGKSSKDLNYLQQLEDSEDVDFWNGPSLGHNSTVLIPPHRLAQVQSEMSANGISWNVLNLNVTEIVKAGMAKTVHSQSAAMSHSVIDHENYHNYKQIQDYLNALKSEYPQNIELSKLRYLTYEYRQVTMSKLFGTNNDNKPSIMIEAGMHAREWISPASVLYFTEQILKRYHSNDPVAKFMLDTYNWYVIPVANPDGYDFTHLGEAQRFWRKNRRIIRNWWTSGCIGIDLNRNFDAKFGTTGISRNCRSIVYPGEEAFSEPESKNIRDVYSKLKSSLVAYMAVHSYSQYLLLPWGWSLSGNRPANHGELERVSNLMAQAIFKSDNKVFQVGSVYDLLQYAASGSSQDWALESKKGIYAITYELRPDPQDGRGFNLPPTHIVPSGEEFMASLEVLAKEMKLDGLT